MASDPENKVTELLSPNPPKSRGRKVFMKSKTILNYEKRHCRNSYLVDSTPQYESDRLVCF